MKLNEAMILMIRYDIKIRHETWTNKYYIYYDGISIVDKNKIAFFILDTYLKEIKKYKRDWKVYKEFEVKNL